MFRTDLYPVVISVPMDDHTVEDYARLFEYFSGLFRKRARFASVADTRKLTRSPSPTVRTFISEFSKGTHEVNKVCCVANYLVVSNAVIKAALQALDWVHRPAAGRKIVTTERDGVVGATTILEGHGVHISPALREYVERGVPHFLSMRTRFDWGPSVTRTASARAVAP
jgi:hypothetical protein